MRNTYMVLFKKFERCLKHIFAKYCTPRPTIMHSPVKQHVPLDRDPLESPIIENGVDAQLLIPPPGAYFTAAALDQWATDTNGTPLPKEAKEELTALSTVWKQVFDPVLEYCQVCSVPWLL